MELEKIKRINEVISTYFQVHTDVTRIPAKDLMNEFIKNEIFSKDHRNGLPIRNLLRELDKLKQLNKIPYLLAERKQTNTNWYFIRIEENSTNSTQENTPQKTFKPAAIINHFKQEAGELSGLFQIFELSIPDAENSKEEYIFNPGVYVFLEADKVIKVGRSLTNSRKRSLEHIRDATKNDTFDMTNLKNNPKAKLLLFNLKDPKKAHWAAAFEIFFETLLEPLIPSKRQG